ncbi:phage tail spike protein [Lacticaseibacillus absianus]|uniref:phage tail spike protein n=1 Tax=Lacticaseibacillus absianus TaxID=2729623 RepID=UPI003CCE28AE
MDVYITDRKYNLLAIATAGGDGPLVIGADTDTEMVPQSVGRAYEGTIYFSTDQLALVTAAGKVGNYLMYQDTRGRYVFMTLMEVRLDSLTGTLEFTAENGGIDLINETVGSYTAAKAMSIAEYIDLFAADSGFEIGVNELEGQARTLKWESEEETALARVESVATQFDAELDFRFEITGTQVVKRYIDIYHHIGADKGQRMEVNTHINKIVTISNIYDLCTSISPTGGTPEGKDTPINLKGYKWTDPDGRFVLGADGVLRDTVAVQLWSRALSNDNPNPNNHHIQRSKPYEAVTQATLLQSALADLKQYNHAAVNYEVDLVDLPDSVMVGDTVHLVDEEQGLNLSARLLQLETSYSEGTRTATFGDYLIEASQIDPALQDLADQIKRIPKTVQYYPWVRYADDDQGTGLSALPAGKAYMAIVYGNTSVPSDEPADYAGKWAKVVGPAGKDGNDGKPGEAGKDGRTPYFHKAYANSMAGLDFSTTDATGKAYLGTYSDFAQADSTDPTSYKWQLVKGEKGDPGKDGKDGKDGAENVPVMTIGPAYPASPKSGDIHWLTDAKGVVTGYYLYDGTTWVPKSVDASTIAAETFVGKTFQGMHFIGSDFTNSYELVPEDVGAEGDPTYIYHSGTLAMKDGKLEAHDSIYKADKTTLANQITMAYDPTQGLMMQTFDATGKKEQYYMAMSPAAGSMIMRTPDHIGQLDAGYLEQLNGAGKLLWSGGYYMTGTQIVTPSVPLNKCLNGWVILWSYYNNGASSDSDWNTTIINKNWGAVHSGKGIVTPMSTATGSVRTQKYLFVTNTTLKGYTSGSDGNGSGDAAKFVMREVYAF